MVDLDKLNPGDIIRDELVGVSWLVTVVERDFVTAEVIKGHSLGFVSRSRKDGIDTTRLFLEEVTAPW